MILGKTLNNKEYLIQILLKLRSVGIKNEKILQAIEKMPPHYYYSMSNFSEKLKKINKYEVLEIAKLLQLSLNINYKYDNVLVYGFKYGWLLVLLTNFCKRVYGICDSAYNKNKVKYFFLKNDYKNIYINSGKDILSWSKVAPFDLIYIFNLNKFSNNDITKQLSSKGQAFIPCKEKNCNFNMICIDKENVILRQTCDYSLLNSSDLI